MKRLLMLLTLILMACTEQAPVETGTTETVDKPVVVTSNYPLYFFASEIAGDAVDVQFPEIDGDPAFWAPDGDDAALLQTANLVILNGAGYESWLAFTTLHEGRMLDTTAGLSDRLLPMDEAAVHQHGPEGEHSHEGTAFTTWLNPRLAAEQARQVTQGLTSLVPDQAERFTTRLTALEDRLNVLDAELERAFESLADESVIWSHPVYQYLQHRYAIDGRSVHWEPDQDPGTREWLDFGNRVRERPASLMIWEDQPLPEVVTRLGEMGIRSLVFRPCGNRPASGDFFSIMAESVLSLGQTPATPSS